MAVSSRKRIKTAQRRARMLELRQQGWGWADIAAGLGYSSASHASKDCVRALRQTVREPAQQLVELELQRLDKYVRACEELGLDLPTIDRLIALSARRSRLLGLDGAGANNGGIEEGRSMLAELSAQLKAVAPIDAIAPLGPEDDE